MTLVIATNRSITLPGTNPDANPYHPLHFNRGATGTNPVIDIGATDANYLDDDDDTSSHLGADSPSSWSRKQVFDICNYTDPESKQFCYWEHTQPNAQPPAGLMYFYVATFYRKEIALLDKDY